MNINDEADKYRAQLQPTQDLGMSGCTCAVTDSKTWTTYGSDVEPGSMMEPDPDCPDHFSGPRRSRA